MEQKIGVSISCLAQEYWNDEQKSKLSNIVFAQIT
jgi:hypothetical protein